LSSRNLVIESLKFKNLERIPRQLWVLPWAEIKYPDELKEIKNSYPDDIIYSPSFLKKPLPIIKEDNYKMGKYTDEWGCTRHNLQDGIAGEVKEPLVSDWSQVHKVHVPEERLSIDIEKINKFCANTDKFVLPEVYQRPFERLQFLRKTENLFIDLLEKPKGFSILLDKIHQFYIEEIKLWCKTNVDGIFLMDDWGAQNSLLINPELWKKTWKPMYKEYIDIAHKYEKYVFMHSDGNIFTIIPELIEIGLDALNAQLFCMDIEEIGKRFKGKITFWGEIDRQHLLPYGSMKDIELAVKKVYENLYLNGGVIAQCEFGPGAKPENIQQVFKTWDTLCK